MENEAQFDSWFPESLRKEFTYVMSIITGEVDDITSKISDGYNSDKEIYVLSDGTKIKFPYRIYFQDDDQVYPQLNYCEKLIYDCIFTRSDNGHIREKHLRRLFAADIPEWCLPYIVRSSADYVLEIVNTIYDRLKMSDNSLLQTFCRNNPEIIKTNYSRMQTYWNEYYRKTFPKFEMYIGQKLFSEFLTPDLRSKDNTLQI